MTREHYDTLLRQLDEQVLDMGKLVVRAIESSIDALDRGDVAEAQRLIEADTAIDKKRYALENGAFVLIATQQPTARDLRTVTAILTIATELERIGDYAEGIAKVTLRMAAEPMRTPMGDIRSMTGVTLRLLRSVLEAFERRDVEIAGDVWAQDDEVDDLYESVFRQVIAHMADEPSSVRCGTYLLWVAHDLERMSDRVTNIAERIAFIVTGDVAAFREELRAQSLPG